MNFITRITAIIALLWLGPALAADSGHPRLLLSSSDAEHIASASESSPGFARSLEATRARVDAYFALTPDVPLPKDAGGGYTHERHKKNGVAIHDAGMLFQLSGDPVYVEYAKGLLLAYAGMYPSLGDHPKRKEQSPGRLFWQSLNEAVWLVYVIQGYDAIYDHLSAEDRSTIEQELLRPMARFLSVESPQTFDKIHNHGTWAVAAVGMTGYVLDDEDYVQQALYGLSRDGKAGFLKQLDLLFSPDGYYNEGPYYQRYALMPFVLFASAIQANEPTLNIFKYRDGILLKAIYTCIDLSYGGLFFPINDAIKDKGLDTIELRYGIPIAWGLTQDRSLLSIAEKQSSFVLTSDGFAAAKAIDDGLATAFDFRSVLLRDGPEGDKGALAILRNGRGDGHHALVFKSTSQGMGHGHFDKLNWLYYHNEREIVTDYGAARFLNVEQKYGGHYLPENNSWAKQTVAHNTLVVDERSHFDGKVSVGEQFHPVPLYFEANDDIQITSASMEGAYPEVQFSRTMAFLNGVVADGPVVVDVLSVSSKAKHQYDLPLHFSGQFIATNHELESATDKLVPLGKDNGYQHLWLRAQAGLGAGEQFSLTWLNANRFYTYTTLAQADSQVLLTELGANDPNFNLRPELALILRSNGTANHSFVSVLEPHGEYNGSEEFTVDSAGRIDSLQRYTANGTDLIRLQTSEGNEFYLGLSYDADTSKEHSVTVGERIFRWKGFYGLFPNGGGSR